MVVDGKAGLNVVDGWVSEAESAIDGLWIALVGGLTSGLGLDPITLPAPIILLSLFIKSS